MRPFNQIKKSKRRQALSVVAQTRRKMQGIENGSEEDHVRTSEGDFKSLAETLAGMTLETEEQDLQENTYYKEYDAPVWALENLEHAPDNILGRCLFILSSSPTARAFITEAQVKGWRAGLADLGGPDFSIDVPEKTLLLDNNALSADSLGSSVYFFNMLLFSLIRALRDIWQERRYGGFDETYEPQSTLMLERIRAADCDIMAILVAWELRSAGYNDLWRHVIGSEEGDLAMTFSDYLERNPTTTFTNAALKATFKRWFAVKERINACDHETLCYLDNILSEYPGRNPFGSNRATANVIELLSCKPDKTAYLQGMGPDILCDPAYAGLDDSINQSHLLQILHDCRVVYAGDVPFQDEDLAQKIFPPVGESCPSFIEVDS